MQYMELINEKVHSYYWNDDLNCAITSLRILSEIFQTNLCSQIVSAGIGMPGAGGNGAQCGLVSGSLMFIGILGKENGQENMAIVKMCNEFAKRFENEFGSLDCRVLRPQGFKADNPPHLCEEITKKAIMFTMSYLNSLNKINL